MSDSEDSDDSNTAFDVRIEKAEKRLQLERYRKKYRNVWTFITNRWQDSSITTVLKSMEEKWRVYSDDPHRVFYIPFKYLKDMYYVNSKAIDYEDERYLHLHLRQENNEKWTCVCDEEDLKSMRNSLHVDMKDMSDYIEFFEKVAEVQKNDFEILNELKITNIPMYKRSKMGIGYLPQEVSVFRKLSVEDNIKAILEMSDLSKKEQNERLEELINEFGLNYVRKNLGRNLSGGEKRRTEIARCLANEPDFILLDEPFAGVDPIAVEDIQRIVMKLKKKNIGILITDHNVQETLSIVDRAYLLFEGDILKDGTAEILAQDEQVRKVYLGQKFELNKKPIDF